MSFVELLKQFLFSFVKSYHFIMAAILCVGYLLSQFVIDTLALS